MITLISNMVRSNLKSQPAYLDWLKADLADCESILELGCGANSPILKIGYGKKTYAVDIWKPYIEKHNRKRDYRECWQADILKMPFTPKGFDAVVMFDVMEHLPISKDEMKALLDKFESAARKKVILFTPNGFIENDHVDGDPWQAHVSAWEPEDYPGYKVRGADGFRWLFGKAGIVKYKPRVFFEYLGQFSQPLVYYLPKLAWHSYVVKELNGRH